MAKRGERWSIMATLVFKAVTVDGVEIFNTTPHAINFGVGDEVKEVPTCGVLVNASSSEEVVKTEGGVEFVRTKFTGNDEGRAIIAAMKAANPDAVIVGSIIAAQAYPGEVVAMTPLPGYERVAPAEKRMNPHKFTTFA